MTLVARALVVATAGLFCSESGLTLSSGDPATTQASTVRTLRFQPGVILARLIRPKDKVVIIESDLPPPYGGASSRCDGGRVAFGAP